MPSLPGALRVGGRPFFRSLTSTLRHDFARVHHISTRCLRNCNRQFRAFVMPGRCVQDTSDGVLHFGVGVGSFSNAVRILRALTSRHCAITWASRDVALQASSSQHHGDRQLLPSVSSGKDNTSSAIPSAGLVLCLSPYPWDCCCISISAQHDIAAPGSQRSILLAIGVDSGGQGRALGVGSSGRGYVEKTALSPLSKLYG